MEKYPMNMRYVILKRLEAFIYEPVTIRMQEVLYNLMKRNSALTLCYVDAFWYRGELWKGRYYCHERAEKLHPELHQAMDEYVNERNHIRDVEQPLIMGFLRLILNHSKDTVEMLKLIPESLQKPLDELLRGLPDGRPRLSTDEVAAIIKAPENCVEALKLRMMRNLLEE